MKTSKAKIAVWLNNSWLWLCRGELLPAKQAQALADNYSKQGYKVKICY